MPQYRFVSAEGEKGCARCREGFDVILPVGETLRFCEECGSVLDKVPSVFRMAVREKGSSQNRLDEAGMSVLRRKPDGKFRVEGRPLSENPALQPDFPPDDD